MTLAVSLTSIMATSRADFVASGYCYHCLETWDLLLEHSKVRYFDHDDMVLCLACHESGPSNQHPRGVFHPQCVLDTYWCPTCAERDPPTMWRQEPFCRHIRCDKKHRAFIERLGEIGRKNLTPFQSFVKK